MSQADARLFLERVAENDAFRQSVTLALQEGAERDPQRLVQLGDRHGLSFTEAELAAATTEWLKPSNVELGDAELEAVAGGTGLRASLQAAVNAVMLMSEILTNISQAKKETESAIVRNIR